MGPILLIVKPNKDPQMKRKRTRNEMFVCYYSFVDTVAQNLYSLHITQQGTLSRKIEGGKLHFPFHNALVVVAQKENVFPSHDLLSRLLLLWQAYLFREHNPLFARLALIEDQSSSMIHSSSATRKYFWDTEGGLAGLTLASFLSHLPKCGV